MSPWSIGCCERYIGSRAPLHERCRTASDFLNDSRFCRNAQVVGLAAASIDGADWQVSNLRSLTFQAGHRSHAGLWAFTAAMKE
jgi:hypothetical protein